LAAPAAWKSPKSSPKESAKPSSSDVEEKVKEEEKDPVVSLITAESENGPHASSYDDHE